MEVLESLFTNNKAFTGGGAIDVDDSSFNLIFSNFTNNKAHYRGGAMHFASSTIGNVSLCNFTNNSALVAGVAYMWRNVTVHLQSSHFLKNSARGRIGCSYASHTYAGHGGCITGRLIVEISVFNSSFTENLAKEGSVASMADQCSIDIFGCTFVSNRASEAAIISLSEQVNATISHCNFLFNTKSQDGDMLHGNFQGNNARLQGGVIHAVNGSVVEIRHSIFCHNRASEGRALHIQRSKLTVIYSNFTGNVAEDVGGAIVLLLGTEASISHSVFVGNEASNCGAIFVSTDCVLNLEHCNLTQNHTNHAGGALVFVKGKYESDSNFPGKDNYPRAQIGTTLTIINSIFTTNTAFLVGAVFLSQVSITTILSSKFSNNSAQQIAAIAVADCAVTYMENITFIGNTDTGSRKPNFLLYLGYIFGIIDKVPTVYKLDLKTGGVLSVKHESQLVFKNCSFLQNQAIYAGVALFSDNVHATFDGSNFTEKNGQHVGVFEAVNSVHVEIILILEEMRERWLILAF